MPKSLIHPRAVELNLRQEDDDADARAHSKALVRAAKTKTDSSRVWRDIMFTSQYGSVTGTTGLNRLALSDADQQVRDWFVREAISLDLHINIDEMGNLFATLPGSNKSLPPIGIGSHLDTQPDGGRFDGILGVIGGLEIVRTLKRNGYRNHAPIAAINWTNEEGARFQPGCTGSAVWAGHRSQEQCDALPASEGPTTLADELERIGYKGRTVASSETLPLSAHFELHIEQGSRLEDSGQEVGVVTGIQDVRWFVVDVKGVQCHAGSTPMSKRGDALVAAAKVVVYIEELARAEGGVVTVGTMDVGPGSPNCVPGEAQFAIDLRHVSSTKADLIENSIAGKMKGLEAENDRLGFKITKTWHSPGVKFDGVPADCLTDAATGRMGSEKVGSMMSHAGHDSAMTAQKVPTAMLFVPSHKGISHSPEEYTTKTQCGNGVQVMMDAVLRYDKHLARETRLHESKQQ